MNKKIWIISQQRTGSGYLCELLNNLEVFEEKFSEWYYVPKEKFTKEGKFFFTDIISCFPRYSKLNFDYKKNLPNFCKIHLETMQCMFGNINLLSNCLGENCTFIYIYRKNIIDQIISRYIAIKTGKWRIKNIQEYEIFINKKIEIDEETLVRCIHYVVGANKLNEYYIENCNLSLSYEDLVRNEFQCIKKILLFTKNDFDDEKIIKSIENSKKTIIKQLHPQRKLLMNFIVKYKSLLKIKILL
jgi:LPS sulfotransferase NodH